MHVQYEPHLDLVLLERGALSLLEGDGEGGDGVVVGATLECGENGLVDGSLEVKGLTAIGLGAPVEDHARAGATERLVGGGGDNVGVLEGAGGLLGGDEAGDVGHVDHEVGANLVGDLPEALVLPLAGVGRATGDDEPGLEKEGLLLEGIVVDVPGLLVQAVGEGLEVDGRRADLLLGSVEAVGQVTAVGEVKAHDAVVGAEETRVDGHVGGGSGVGLDVDAPHLGVELVDLEGTLLAEALDLVDNLVTAVVAGAGETLRVLVGEGRAVGVHHAAGGEVLGQGRGGGKSQSLSLWNLAGRHELYTDKKKGQGKGNMAAAASKILLG